VDEAMTETTGTTGTTGMTWAMYGFNNVGIEKCGIWHLLNPKFPDHYSDSLQIQPPSGDMLVARVKVTKEQHSGLRMKKEAPSVVECQKRMACYFRTEQQQFG